MFCEDSVKGVMAFCEGRYGFLGRNISKCDSSGAHPYRETNVGGTQEHEEEILQLSKRFEEIVRGVSDADKLRLRVLRNSSPRMLCIALICITSINQINCRLISIIVW